MQDYTQSPLVDTSIAKRRFRSAALKKLKSIGKTEARLYDHRINRKLIEKIKKTNPKSVMLYIPMKTEADLMPLITYLRARKIPVYVPFMEGESFRLVQYRLPLKKKRFGAREPLFSNKYRNRNIDLAIVPIIGTDATKRRIGFGKGMYDRFFADYPGRTKEIVFVQRVLLISDDIVTDDWDVAANEIITAK